MEYVIISIFLFSTHAILNLDKQEAHMYYRATASSVARGIFPLGARDLFGSSVASVPACRYTCPDSLIGLFYACVLVGKMRVSFVPQTVQGPCRAGLPFFMVICWKSFISRLSLHLTQYAVSAIFSPPLVAIFCILIIYSDSANTCNSIGPFRGVCLYLFFEIFKRAGDSFLSNRV